MGCVIGIDIGAVSIKTAILGSAENQALFTQIAAGDPFYTLAAGQDLGHPETLPPSC